MDTNRASTFHAKLLGAFVAYDSKIILVYANFSSNNAYKIA